MRRLFALFLLLSFPAWAAPPRVVTDIAPVHSLVAIVMGDLGTPEVLLPPQADPHHFQLRPSQARLLANAGLFVWMGPALTPWMNRVSQNLTGGAQLQLLSLDTLASRIEDAPPDSHGALDPHAWLDPMNAAAFLVAISDALSAVDPQNAKTYATNSENAQRRIAALTTHIQAHVTPARDAVLISYHDAFRYFFSRFDLRVAASITDHDAAQPSAGRLRNIRSILANAGSGCILAEPGFNMNLIDGLAPGPKFKIKTLDPIGASLAPGPELYETLITQMADTIADCATP